MSLAHRAGGGGREGGSPPQAVRSRNLCPPSDSPFPPQSSPPRTCRNMATSGSAPSRTMSAPASSLCKSQAAPTSLAPMGHPWDTPLLPLLPSQVRRWPSGRCQYQYSGPQNPEGDHACDRDSGVHKLSGGSGDPPGAERRPRVRPGKDERVLSFPGRAETGADASGSTLYIGVKHPASTRRV